MEKSAKIYVAGHNGLAGSAIVRALQAQGYHNLLLRRSSECNLCRQAEVEALFAAEQPDYVFLCAAKVGGIMANSTYPAEFIYNNLMISTNVIHAAHTFGVKKLLNMGSSCIYPRMAPQPMREDCLLTSELEATNEAYAVAKIAAIKLCRYYNEQYGTQFLSVMPTNQYGVGDNFNMETAHLLPMVLRRLHLAKLLAAKDFAGIQRDLQAHSLGWGLETDIDFTNADAVEALLAKVGAYPNKVVMWGDGSVFRELMHSDDLAHACLYLMQSKKVDDIGELVNITSGTDIQLKALFSMVKDVVGFTGEVEYDTSKPNGTPRKLMDATKIRALGWTPRMTLKEGLIHFYEWYVRIVG